MKSFCLERPESEDVRYIKKEVISPHKSILSPEFEPPSIPEDEKYEGTEVDPNVLSALPDGTRAIWSATYRASFWAISTKIDAEDPEGDKKSYFMKVYTTVKAQAQAIGEYLSTKAIYAVIPDSVPRPIALGSLARDPSKHFYLAEYKDMKEEMPPLRDLASVIANLHNNSISPNGRFGFQVPTSQSLQLENTWCDTWEEFFTRAFRNTVRLEQEIQGAHDELQRLADEMCDKVIPRLLRPMETGGRKLKPTLLHGDLWHGNIGVDLMTDQVVLYDCCAFYGHHEYDLGMFRASRYRTSRAHVDAYNELVPISDPAADFDDRNALYALRVDLEVSCGWPENKRMRQLAIEEMRRLVGKYPGGYEAWEKEEVEEEDRGKRRH
ncbi:hypothetical protein, variant 1 [Cladophialophora immunda]|uniref:protein-ribulosamine 3-kinase n=2 Tax=Cladophialophora immunda TaxID=569365 RepID=A0A0D1ZZI2_9EURO|nr:hypothetical protein, variant 1 [Cladophialophora immunda]KIW33516.1 hypothetical protein, variant 1 [Cladophialophora immunda]